MTEKHIHYIQELAVVLQHNEIEMAVYAMDDFIAINGALTKAVTDALEHSEHKYYIAERLPVFGSCIIPSLIEVVDKSNSQEVQTLGSLVLAQLGSHHGIEHIVKEIDSEGRYACLSAIKLKEIDLDRTIKLLLRKLRFIDVATCQTQKGRDLVDCFLGQLDEVEQILPDDIIAKYTHPDIPHLTRMLVFQIIGKTAE